MFSSGKGVFSEAEKLAIASYRQHKFNMSDGVSDISCLASCYLEGEFWASSR